ncbi:hypothetical protein [uncultured Paraglaciecola sp.]|uniref:hypothetical protein n=1 Tax=uncultured Paraglaciecola sp. TaxID=1765024 RepID=UPI00261AB72B|nr:hypothetical protein [uncultured Paraglaciecola sp.]
MAKTAQLPPHCTTKYVGCVSDIREFLKQLPEDVEGLEETYEVNKYTDRQTGEKWIEIKPTQ